MRALGHLLSALLLLGCAGARGGDGARADAAVSATEASVPQSFVRTEGPLTVQAMPLSMRLTRGATTVLQSPAARPFIEVGVVAGGASPTRFYDPRVDTPSGVTWRAFDRVLPPAGPRDTGLRLGGPGGLRASLTIARDVRRTWVTLAVEGDEVVLLRFNFAADDGAYHGLGEQFAGADARGRVVAMQLHAGGTASGTNEQRVPVPFLVSSKGYGIFVRTLEAGAFDVAATSPDVVRATFEGARATVALYEDEDPLRVVADYTRATSLPRLPPRWSFAPQQGRSAWRSGDEMLDDARRLRREGIPITTLWIDGPWQTSDNDGRIDEARFPNPAALLQTLASLGYRVIFSSAPSLDAVADGAQPMNEAERLFVQARDRGMLVRDASGAPYVSPQRPLSADGPSFPLGALMDFSSVESLWFFRETLRGVIELGGRGFTLDAADALRAEVDGQRTGLRFSYDATERTQRGAYAFHYHNVYRAALARWARDDGVVVVRAANSGGQRDCDIVWPGDLDNDFRAGTDGQVGGLPAAVSALISLSESGFPSFASETGGARGGRPTREALLRWAEHTAMSPFMLLGGGASHNPWTDDAEASVVLRDLARLHLQLVPYFYAQGQRASRDGTPPVRSLALAFPDEPGARGDAFSYLLGPDLLAAPVVTPGATTRRVHIPRGTWVHWFTRERYAGPMEVEVPAPIGRPPLFVRAGAVVPMLAPEVETLVDAASADLVDAADRAAVRGAHIVPRGDVSALVDGAGVRVVASSPTRTELTFTPSGDVSVLRAQVDVGSRGVTSPRVRVRLREVDLPESDLALQGICGRCWHFDASQGIVTLTLQGELAVTITVEPSSP